MLSLTYFCLSAIFFIISCEIVPVAFYCPAITSFFEFMTAFCIFSHLVINSSYFAFMLSSTAIEVVDAVSIFCVLLFWLSTIASVNYFTVDFANFTLSYNICVVDDSIEIFICEICDFINYYCFGSIYSRDSFNVADS